MTLDSEGVTKAIIGAAVSLVIAFAGFQFSSIQAQLGVITNSMNEFNSTANQIHIKLAQISTRNETNVIAITDRLYKTTGIAESNEKMLIAMK